MYAAIDITDTSKTIYHWQYSDYDMDPTDEPFIRARLNKFIYVNNVIVCFILALRMSKIL